eukprot:m.198549 g.198549  ORF g.198549 m.198549 type:complete len:204 (+) comp20472_c0_seq1:319-930(+)
MSQGNRRASRPRSDDDYDVDETPPQAGGGPVGRLNFDMPGGPDSVDHLPEHVGRRGAPRGRYIVPDTATPLYAAASVTAAEWSVGSGVAVAGAAVGEGAAAAAEPPRLEGGMGRPLRRVRVRGDNLVDNPQKTLFQSDGEAASAPPQPVLNLRSLEREVRDFTFCNAEAERLMLQRTQAKLSSLLDGLETDRWRYEPSENAMF